MSTIEFIGILRPLESNLILPRRESLMFDRMAVHGLKSIDRGLKSWNMHVEPIKDPEMAEFVEQKRRNLARDIGYLIDQNVIFDSSEIAMTVGRPSDKIFDDLLQQARSLEMREELLWADARLERLGTLDRESMRGEYRKNLHVLQELSQIDLAISSIVERVFSIWFNENPAFEACSLHTVPRLNQLRDVKTTSNDILKLVIEQFPILDESTPWENIIAFRNGNRDKLLSLRKWIYEVTRNGLPIKEANVELQYLITEYQKAMALYEIKFSRGRIETVVTAALDLLEGVAKVKPSNMARVFFSLKKQRVDLLEAEMKAPGGEISYIVQAQNAFRERPGL